MKTVNDFALLLINRALTFNGVLLTAVPDFTCLRQDLVLPYFLLSSADDWY